MEATMSDAEQPQWPREIWCAPVGEHEFSGDYVLSEWATVPRWEGDTERDRDWHRFIDADIYDSADKYWRDRLEAQEALLKEVMAVLERCPPTSNPTLTAEYNLERIEAWWRLEVRPVLAKP